MLNACVSLQSLRDVLFREPAENGLGVGGPDRARKMELPGAEIHHEHAQKLSYYCKLASKSVRDKPMGRLRGPTMAGNGPPKITHVQGCWAQACRRGTL